VPSVGLYPVAVFHTRISYPFLREFRFLDSTLCSIPRIYTGTKSALGLVYKGSTVELG
jgi:hypothetical protein